MTLRPVRPSPGLEQIQTPNLDDLAIANATFDELVSEEREYAIANEQRACIRVPRIAVGAAAVVDRSAHH